MDTAHLSVRAAAAAAGHSPTTIWQRRRRGRRARDPNLVSVIGRDGKQYPPHRGYDLHGRDEAIRALRSEGLTYAELISRTGWSRGTVHRALAGTPKQA